MVIVVIGFFLIYSTIRRLHGYSPQTHCISNLRQVGTAFRLWADDNDGFYPMHFLGNANYPGLTPAASWLGRPLDYPDASTCFKALSNELGSPKLIVCPSDTRKPLSNYWSLQDSSVSYFVGQDAHQTNANMFLAGDRNVLVDGVLVQRGRVLIKTNNTSSWSEAIHNCSGDVTLADGSVQKFSMAQLHAALQKTGTNVNRLVFP